MKHLTLVMPYYDNPEMLARHYDAWQAFPEWLKDFLDVVIVDDASPTAPAAKVWRPPGLPHVSIFQVEVDKPWHQHAARNIGAHEARGPWLLLTDMDHMVPEATFLELKFRRNREAVYTFTRVDAPGMTPKLHPVSGAPHPHPNSFAMTKDLYWTVGGYDEDYCGVYGTDGMFRSRLFKIAKEVPLPEVLVRYDREVIADASTTSLPRKEGREPGAKQAVADRKRAEGRENVIATLTMPYHRVL